ncbi:MAG: alpha/beta fold hydrolase [Anaerolineales bacterium]|nr:alpha/beta fold hydrolase [Anaerolineales bacterium]
MMIAELNGTKLYYETMGQGTPLMVMHGGLGLDHTGLKDWLAPLADQVELIFYDHRGNGRSDRPDSLEGVTHETFIDDADALRAHLGHEKIILFGHSYGGFLAQDYALKYGDHLAGLVLCCTAPVLDYMEIIQGNAAARGNEAQLGALGAAFGRPMADDADWRQIWMTLLPMYFHQFDEAVAQKMDEATHYSAAAWNHVNANCLPFFNVLDRLGEIRTPTLVASGADDWITPPGPGGERIHAALPNSELKVFADSGHWPFIEEAERFEAMMRDWLSRLDS